MPVFPSMEAQCRWSADVSTCGPPPVIIVKKKKKEPQPPQRCVSLLRRQPPCRDSAKHYSCPSIITLAPSTNRPSSPAPVQTYTIIGPDPLGWKLRPRSGCTSTHPHTAKLSHQIPLPDTVHQVKPSPNLLMESTSQTTLCFESHHRDSNSCGPVETLEPIYALQLCTIQHETDYVYSKVNDKSRGPEKIPPPVAEKTHYARQTAQRLSLSCQHSTVTMNTNEEPMYSSVTKPSPTYSQ